MWVRFPPLVPIIILCLGNLMVECRFYTANTAVQFCHEVPFSNAVKADGGESVSRSGESLCEF